ncbi:TolC family protein [Dyadobacter sediminis]|uniref:TolC family protein n=1 Tax=Dyadobacter sediminis TaxID=1493691 RepID=UPI001486576C|nr:TolC family protein [Dyadobacter sediminis]GGB76816.1 cation transporter [Dyadobacter sediminis]
MKVYIIAFFALASSIISLTVSAQDTLRIRQKEAEALFLGNNLDLIAQKLSIRQAEASIIQAKLWPNPEFSLDEVNLWTTRNQLSSGETIPPLFGNFGRNREFTAELSQLIETGGKRRKRMALESVSRDMATEYFSELIREMKLRLRENLFELAFQQSHQTVLTNQQTAVTRLLTSFESQYQQGNVSKPELFRLRALKLELSQEMVESQMQINSLQKDLAILLHTPAGSYLVFETPELPDTEALSTLALNNLTATALANRPDSRISLMQQDWARKKYDYEYAQRKPDVHAGINYDRGGNFLLNFFGFGLKFDVPVFNRNQGNILESRIGMEQSDVQSQQKVQQIETEVTAAFRDLQNSFAAYRSLDPAYSSELDSVLEAYTRYFTQRNVNLIEYLDFFEAYISNKRTIFNTIKQLRQSRETLIYTTGAEI